ncbi:MAG TPA: OPT/YSL family transporter [Kofleriaceae bacterium]
MSRELTIRALAIGAALAVLLTVVNTYMGLKTGWVESGTVTASLLGFAICSLAVRMGAAPSNPLELNIIQNVAVAAGAVSTVVGLIGPIPALQMLGRAWSTPALFAWGIALCALGVILAIRLRPRLIEGERPLRFPSGVATAEIIRAVFRSGNDGLRRASALGIGAAVAGLIAWLRDGSLKLIPALVPLRFPIAGVDAGNLAFGIATSPMMIGVGLLVGPATGLGVLLGAVIAWCVIAPYLIEANLVASADYPSLVQWLVWPAVAMMIASSVTNWLMDWRTIVSALRGSRSPAARSTLLGLVAAIAVAVLVASQVIGVRIEAALLGFAILPLLVGVAARAAGETDVAPLGDMGTITQAVLAQPASGDPQSTLAPAGAVTGVGMQTTSLLLAFKTTSILGGNRARVMIAQLVGITIGLFASIPLYQLLDSVYGIGTGEFPSPTALSWRATAEAMAGGGAALPDGAALAAAISAGIGVALTLAGRIESLRRWAPAPAAVGIGFLVPFAYALPIALGGFAAGALARKRPALAETTIMPVASGAIAGEALVALGLAVAAAASAT